MRFITKIFTSIIIILIFISTESSYGSKKKFISSLSGANYNKELIDQNADQYIVGSEDVFKIEIELMPELTNTIKVAPDGYIYLPKIRSLYVSGLTFPEIANLLTNEYSKFVIDPLVFITPVSYKPIKIFVDGEVPKPGFYSLSGVISSKESLGSTSGSFPTLFDALKKSGGVTRNSDLGNIEVIRKVPIGKGGGYKTANIDFLSVLIDLDISKNIRLFDGDVIKVKKGNSINKIFAKISKTNITPEFINIYISGRIEDPGKKSLPKLSTLNTAIDIAGGTKVIRGKIFYYTYGNDLQYEKKIISYKSNAKPGSIHNPYLKNGDIIRISKGIIGSISEPLDELTTPILGIFALENLFN